MSIYLLKPKFQALLRPLAKKLYQLGITANQVTLLACLISIMLGVLLTWQVHLSWLFCLLPIWLFIRMAFNAIDGMLAREFNQQSKLGAYLNEITDVVSDAALYLPFALIAPFTMLQIGLLIWLSALSEMVGVLGQVYGNGRRYDGPMGKSDRAFVLGALALWYTLQAQLPDFSYGIMWLIIALLLLTCYRRIKLGLTEN